MARSAFKAASESDITLSGEEALDFDDDNLRGEKPYNSLSRGIDNADTCFYLDMFSPWVMIANTELPLPS